MRELSLFHGGARRAVRTCSAGRPLDKAWISTTAHNELSGPESTTASCPPPPSSAISAHSTVTGTPQHNSMADAVTAGFPASSLQQCGARTGADDDRNMRARNHRSHPPGSTPLLPAGESVCRAPYWRYFGAPYWRPGPSGMTLAGEFYPLPAGGGYESDGFDGEQPIRSCRPAGHVKRRIRQHQGRRAAPLAGWVLLDNAIGDDGTRWAKRYGRTERRAAGAAGSTRRYGRRRHHRTKTGRRNHAVATAGTHGMNLGDGCQP